MMSIFEGEYVLFNQMIDQEGATGWELHVSSCVGMGEHESYHHPMWLTPPPPSLPTPARTIADPNKVFLIFT